MLRFLSHLALAGGVLVALTTVPTVHAQSADDVFDLDAPPFQLDGLPGSHSAAAGGGELPEVFGFFNVVSPSGTPGSVEDGIGTFEVPATLPEDGVVITTPLAVVPQPYSEVTPRSGVAGPDGQFYFVGNVDNDQANLALFSIDPEDPGADYTFISDAVEDGLLVPGTEVPAGLGYDPETERAVLVTKVCSEVDGTYRQSFLYDIDLATGALSNRFELRDPDAPDGDNDGVCLFSASWDPAGTIFGADGGGDIAEVDVATGLLVNRYPVVTETETIERVQDAAFDPVGEAHIVLPFTLSRENGNIIGVFTRAYVCTSAGGCDFRGFVVVEDGDGFLTLEMLAVSAATPPPVASEAGAGEESLRLDVYPNPARANGTVALRLDAPERVAVTVRDLLGRTVAVLHDGPTARLDLTFDAARLSAGMYVVVAEGESFRTVRKLIVTR